MLQVKLVKPTPENCFLVPLTRGKVAIVDLAGSSEVFNYIWRAVLWNFRWYAYSTSLLDGTRCRVAMHRLIAETPHGEVCHHYNKNTLDNRFANLLNMTNRLHGELHRIRRWGRKKKHKTSRKRQ